MKKKIENIIIIVLLIILIFIMYLKFVKRVNNIGIFGYHFFIVETGSMEPYLKINDFIIVKKQDDYKEKDVITFKENKSLVTHRIVAKKTGYFVTKGDANNARDSKVLEENVIGKVIYNSNYLGVFIVKYLKYIMLFYCLILVTIYIYKNIRGELLLKKK